MTYHPAMSPPDVDLSGSDPASPSPDPSSVHPLAPYVDMDVLGELDMEMSRGKCYAELRSRGFVERILTGGMTQQEASDILGYAVGTVSKSMKAHRFDIARTVVEQQRIEKAAKDLFPELVLGDYGDDELWCGCTDDPGCVNRTYDERLREDGEARCLVGYFATWRHRYFRDRKNRPYTLPTHQRRWTFRILRAIRDGGNLLILSPPRHGKTDLLIHLDTFFIVRLNRNISIVKVAKSEGMAKKAVGAVRDQLEFNEELINDHLGEGGSYKPAYGARRPWSNLEMTTMTRDITGLKSPTMVAVGMGGSLLSRDGEIFALDDVQDQRNIKTPEAREGDRTWFANDYMSRKEEFDSAMLAIGSRQHPDDLWGYIADNPEWEVVIERAHDEAECTVEDPDNPENWDKHVDCMLWPEVRSYRWLMSIKHDPERSSTYAMVYLNEPQDTDIDVFTRETFDHARDFDRITVSDPLMARRINVPYPYPETNGVDEDGIYHPIRLVGGLDPSATGYQSSFLWGFDPAAFKMYAVDFENRLGGGIVPARDIIARWNAWYGLKFWVVEKNLYHGGIVKDEILSAFCAKEGIVLIDHETYANKWDQELGVSALARAMIDDKVSIPWGDVNTEAKWAQFRKSAITFSRDRKARGRGKAHSDILMAAWFPYEVMVQWRREWLADQSETDNPEDYLFQEMADIYASVFAGDMRFASPFIGSGT